MSISKLLTSAALLFVAAAATAQSKYPSILWEIKKPGMAKTSYLFGTYHISNKGVFKLADSIFIALKSVDMVGTEVNNNNWQREDDDYYKMKYSYDILNSTGDETSMSEGTFRKTNSISKLPLFISLQASSINYFLYRNNKGNEDFEEEAFLDRFIASAGYKLGKKIVGLENFIESNIKLIEADKESKLEDKRSNKKLPDGLSYSMISDMIFDGYKNNSLDMLDSLNKYNFSSDAYYKKFIIDRNYNQADSMDFYMQAGNALFAAVGSAHLPGDEGIIEILRKKGYSVRPVKLSGHAKDVIDNIKKTIYPAQIRQYKTDEGYSYVSPGILFPSIKNNLLKVNSYVDMANGSFYQLARLYNNSSFFGVSDTAVIHAIDSLLFENIKGDIVDRKRIIHQGYTGMDVTSLVKNKDKERYRFIVTPYEIVMLKAGGKNEYVQQKQVDSFFTEFRIEPVKSWHQWTCSFFGRPDNKIRYSKIEGNTSNGVIRVSLNERDLKTDDDYLKLAAESFAASLSLQKEESNSINLKDIKNNGTYNYKLNNNGMALVKYSVQPPFLYVYYSAAFNNDKPTLDWVSGFAEETTRNNFAYVFKDSLKAIEVKLPYLLTFDSKWQKITEKDTYKPDPDKKLNRDNALEYRPETIYMGKRNWDTYQFINPENNSRVWAVTASIDSNFYYANAGLLWKEFIPSNQKYSNDVSRSITTAAYESDYITSDYSSGSYSSNSLRKKTGFVTSIQYDTANKQSQKVSFIVGDSLSTRAMLYTYYLINNKVYGFSELVTYPENKSSVFYESIVKSFKPFNNDKPSRIFESKLQKLAVDYAAAKELAQSDIAESMNYFHFALSDLPAVDNALVSLKDKTPSNNILRKKLIDVVSSIDAKDGDWLVLSGWLRKIYENKDELLTIRLQALETILDKSDASDAAWVLDNLENNDEFKSSTVRRELLNYFSDIKEKELVRKAVKLDDFGSPANNQNFIYYRRVTNLFDSGFYSRKELASAFKEIQKATADNKISLALKAEADQFKYTENEKKKNNYNNYSDNNFQYYTNMFHMFYSALPDESFFETSFQSVLSGGTAKDKTELLQALVKQKKTPVNLVAPLLKSLENEKTYYLDIYRTFSLQNKVDELGAPFTSRVDIAKAYLKGNSYSSDQVDTIYHYQTITNIYYPADSVYFFLYKRKTDRNPQLAYTILPLNMKLFNTDKRIDYELTDEQLTGKETFEAISSRILRKNYVNSLLTGSRSRIFYLKDKSEKSTSSEE